jgi:hypothetical protein
MIDMIIFMGLGIITQIPLFLAFLMFNGRIEVIERFMLDYFRSMRKPDA